MGTSSPCGQVLSLAARPASRAVGSAFSGPGFPPLRALPLVSRLVLHFLIAPCTSHPWDGPSSTSPRPTWHLSQSQTPSWTRDTTPASADSGLSPNLSN